MEPYLKFNCRSAITNILQAATKKIGQQAQLFLVPGYTETAPAQLCQHVLFDMPQLPEADIVKLSSQESDEDYKNVSMVPVLLEGQVIGAVEVPNPSPSLSKDQKYVIYVAANLMSSCLSNYVKWNALGNSLEKPPKVDTSQKTEDVVKIIVKEFESIRKRPKDDGWYTLGGKETFEMKVSKYVAEGVAIPFIVLGFPLKSTNTKTKVLGDLPDMAEYLSIKNIDTWCNAVKALYPPGVRFVIFSDGRIYAPFLMVPDETVLKYRQRVINLVQSKHIVWLGLEDFLPQEKFGHNEKRLALDALYSENMDVINKEVKGNVNFQYVHEGFKNLLTMETQFKDLEAAEKQTSISKTGINMMQRNKVYSDFVASLLSDHIRLSIHSHNNTDKVGVNLFGSEDDAVTPWHSCAVLRKSGTWELKERQEAERRGYELRGSPGAAAPPELQHFVEV